MTRSRGRHRNIAAARRGHIIQRVLVGGCSPGEVAAEFSVEERWVAAWVADYRRYGMASLRDGEVAPEARYARLARRLRIFLLRTIGRHRRGRGNLDAAPCVVLRGKRDDRRRPG